MFSLRCQSGIFPSFAAPNSADRPVRDAVLCGDCHLASFGGLDLPDLLNCQVGASVAMTAVSNGIETILTGRFPREVARINAAEVSISARVSGVMLWSRSLAVGKNAHKLMRSSDLSKIPEHSVALVSTGTRPSDAFIAFVADMGS